MTFTLYWIERLPNENSLVMYIEILFGFAASAFSYLAYLFNGTEKKWTHRIITLLEFNYFQLTALNV